ncbi:MAG TPA: hypothetical protein DEB06_03555 [Phycisphaerales bacterium]|nr:hypothetical protein [Phycisphaerales bacterium]
MTPSGAPSLALAVGIGAAVSLLCARWRQPAVLPLLLTGIALGPGGLGLVDGVSLGAGLDALIAIAIGLLVFEGGLHLDREELGRAPRAVRGLLTVGALAMWIGASLAAWLIAGLHWSGAVVLGAALIVTGPTVVQPILRRVRLKPALHTALSAEAVLVDPIGVLATVFALDVVLGYLRGQEASGGEMVWKIAQPVLAGALAGVLAGVGARAAAGWLTRRSHPDPKQLSLFAAAACMLSVGAGEAMAEEAGLVAAAIGAIILANTKFPGASELKQFMEQVSTILVGMLFVLLASGFDTRSLMDVDWRHGAFVGVLVLIVRPIGVALATRGSSLGGRERVFAALTAPRGIVAASVAALVAAQFESVGGAMVVAESETGGTETNAALGAILVEQGRAIEQLMLLTIVVTVTLASVFSGPLGSALRVRVTAPTGVVIIGMHALGRAFARALAGAGVPVRVADSNPGRIADAREAGLRAFQGDATDLRWLEDTAIDSSVGWLVAWTGNADVERVLLRWGQSRFGAGHARSWGDMSAGADSRRGSMVGQALERVIDRVEAGELEVVVSPLGGAGEGGVPLAWITDGAASFSGPPQRSGKGPSEGLDQTKTKVVSIRERGLG